MTSPTYSVTQLLRSIQYTGSNSADIDAAVSAFYDFVIVSESAGTLHATQNGNPLVINTGDWVTYSVNGVGVLGNNQYSNELTCLATCDQLNALEARVTALEAV